MRRVARICQPYASRPDPLGRTVLIIAHRLASLRHCDRIVTMEGGTITEEGTHEALLKAGGRYASLWREQMGAMSAE